MILPSSLADLPILAPATETLPPLSVLSSSRLRILDFTLPAEAFPFRAALMLLPSRLSLQP